MKGPPQRGATVGRIDTKEETWRGRALFGSTTMQQMRRTAEIAAEDQQSDGVSRESPSGDIVSVAKAGDNDNDSRRFEPTKHWRFFAGTD